MSVLCSTCVAIQYTVTMWSTSSPSPNTSAPGRNTVHGTSGACGMCQLTKTHAATGMAMYASVATSPATNDRSRRAPASAANANATVTRRTRAPTARIMLGGLPARVCHTSACTMRNTFNSARVARSNAKAATKNDRMRWAVDRSPMPENAFAANPPMPASRARLAGSSSAALAPRPKITTTRNTYGIMNRKTRNATAPANTPPPASTSRSNAPSAASITLELGRFSSSRSR